MSVMPVSRRSAGADAEPGCLSGRIDICSEENEFPVILLFLPLYHAADFVVIIYAAGVFHAVCGYNEDRFLRYVFFPCVFVDSADVFDRAADRIQQSRAPAHIILSFSHRLYAPDILSVIDHLGLVVEEDRRHIDFALFFFLLFDHAVESADRISLKSGHRSASVEYHDEFCKTFSHLWFLLLLFTVIRTYNSKIAVKEVRPVARRATNQLPMSG